MTDLRNRYVAARTAYYDNAAHELREAAKQLLFADVRAQFPTAIAVVVYGEYNEEMELRCRLTAVLCPEGPVTDDDPTDEFARLYEDTMGCLDDMAAASGEDYLGETTINLDATAD
jgi:hypothetical protein